MTDETEVLDRSPRSVLALAGKRGPLLAPMAFWSDGSALWMSTPAVSVKAAVVRSRPEVSVYVPAPHGLGAGVLIRGTARVFGLHDPLGLAVHAPVISAAMAALAARNAGTILGYVQDARHVPVRFRPRNRVAVRVAIEHITRSAPPSTGPSVAPALPAVLPQPVRRALSGERMVTVAVGGPGGSVDMWPACWGSGFVLQLPPEAPDLEGPAAVYLGTDPRRRPTQVVGLTLTGSIAEGRLRPERATWWEGFGLQTLDLPAAAPSITLPD